MHSRRPRRLGLQRRYLQVSRDNPPRITTSLNRWSCQVTSKFRCVGPLNGYVTLYFGSGYDGVVATAENDFNGCRVANLGFAEAYINPLSTAVTAKWNQRRPTHVLPRHSGRNSGVSRWRRYHRQRAKLILSSAGISTHRSRHDRQRRQRRRQSRPIASFQTSSLPPM